MTQAAVAAPATGIAAAVVLASALALQVTSFDIAMASLIAGGLLAVASVAAWKLPGRLARGVSGGIAAAAPMVWVGCMIWLSEPLVVSHFRCGTGLVGLYLIGAGAFVAAPAVGAVVMAAAGGRAVRLVRAAGVAVGALLLAALIPQALGRVTLPEPQTWAETLPEVGLLPAVATRNEAAWCDLDAGPGPAASCPEGYECNRSQCQRSDQVTVAGTVMHRTCTLDGWCSVSLVESGAEGEDEWSGFGEPVSVNFRAPVLVRRDAPRDLWILGDGNQTTALDGGTGLAVDVDLRRVADALGPPRDWVVTASAGPAVALFALLLAAAAWLRARRTRRARAGLADAYGTIAFDDGDLPSRGATTKPVPPGPVVATAAGRAAPPSYRAVGGPAAWVAISGDRSALVADCEARTDAWMNVALATVWLTAAPLAAAARWGLLG